MPRRVARRSTEALFSNFGTLFAGVTSPGRTVYSADAVYDAFRTELVPNSCGGYYFFSINHAMVFLKRMPTL